MYVSRSDIAPNHYGANTEFLFTLWMTNTPSEGHRFNNSLLLFNIGNCIKLIANDYKENICEWRGKRIRDNTSGRRRHKHTHNCLSYHFQPPLSVKPKTYGSKNKKDHKKINCHLITQEKSNIPDLELVQVNKKRQVRI